MVLGGMAVAPVTRGLQGLPICGRGASFDSREGGGSGEVPGSRGGGRRVDKFCELGTNNELAHSQHSSSSTRNGHVTSIRFPVPSLAQRRPRRLLGLRERSSDLGPGRETWRPDRGEARQHGRQPGCAPLARLPATRRARSFAQAAWGDSSPEFHLPFDAILKRCRASLLVAG